MKKKLLQTPSPRAAIRAIADYAELVCWRQGEVSTTDLISKLGRLEENDYSAGGVPEEDPVNHTVDQVFDEFSRRGKACRHGYPYAVHSDGHLLESKHSGTCHKSLLYKYFLLATRLNMTTNETHANIDGTSLFEDVAAEIARCYFGSRAESFVFGTSSGGQGFEARVNTMCDRMRIRSRFNNPDPVPPTARDDKLDVVVWKHFADYREGMLVGFGQCKTGTNYGDRKRTAKPILIG